MNSEHCYCCCCCCSLFIQFSSDVQFVRFMSTSNLYHMVLLSNVLIRKKSWTWENCSCFGPVFLLGSRIQFSFLFFIVSSWSTVISAATDCVLVVIIFDSLVCLMFIHMWHRLFNCSFVFFQFILSFTPTIAPRMFELITLLRAFVIQNCKKSQNTFSSIIIYNICNCINWSPSIRKKA